MMTTDLKDKLALITGGSRGIGAAIADTLGEAGATVIATATSQKGADAISDRFRSKSIQGEGRVLNVNDSTSIPDFVKALTTEFAAPQILVNNAGITRDQLLLRMKEDDWDAIMQTNLKSVYLMSKACLRGMMKAKWGRIISVASVVGVMGNPGQANYAAAKAGIIGFSKSLAREVGGKNVTVNVVAPGFIDTDMTQALEADQREILEAQIPLNRLGSPQDIAAAVQFLASDHAGYITGETMHVNGGMLMT